MKNFAKSKHKADFSLAKIIRLVCLMTLASTGLLAYSVKVLPVKINYFGDIRTVLINLDDSVYTDNVQGDASKAVAKQRVMTLSPARFLTLTKAVRAALAAGDFNLPTVRAALAAGDFKLSKHEEGFPQTGVKKVMLNLPEGYLPSMLVSIETEQGMTLVPAIGDLLASLGKKETDEAAAGGASAPRAEVDYSRLAELAFGPGYEEALKRKVFTLFSQGTGSNFYYHSQKAEDIRRFKQDEIVSLKSPFARASLPESDEEFLKTQPSSMKAWNTDKCNSYGMFNGEITATFAKYAQGHSLLNYFQIDGPGSGNFGYQTNFVHWETDKQHWDKTGNLVGFGMASNVENARLIVMARLGKLNDYLRHNLSKINPLLQVQLFLINHLSQAHSIDTLNTIGWSRGAVVTIRLSNALAAKAITPDELRMNIVAVDPVPGFAQHKPKADGFLSPLVKSYLAFYAQHELASVFVPVLPKPSEISTCPEYEIYTFPGHHAAVAGSNSTARDDLNNPNYVSEGLKNVSILIRNLAFQHLNAKGTGLDTSDETIFFTNLQDKSKLEMYNGLRTLLENGTFDKIAAEGYGSGTSEIHEKIGTGVAATVTWALTLASPFTGGLTLIPASLTGAATVYMGKSTVARGGGKAEHLESKHFRRFIHCSGYNDNYHMFQCPEFSVVKEGELFPRELVVNRHHHELLKAARFFTKLQKLQKSFKDKFKAKKDASEAEATKEIEAAKQTCLNFVQRGANLLPRIYVTTGLEVSNINVAFNGEESFYPLKNAYKNVDKGSLIKVTILRDGKIIFDSYVLKTGRDAVIKVLEDDTFAFFHCQEITEDQMVDFFEYNKVVAQLFRQGLNPGDKASLTALQTLVYSKRSGAAAAAESLELLTSLNFVKKEIARDGYCCKNSLLALCPGLTAEQLRQSISELCDSNSYIQSLKGQVLASYDSGNWAGVIGDQMCQLELIAADYYLRVNENGSLAVYNSMTQVFSDVHGRTIAAEDMTTGAHKVIIYNGGTHYDATERVQ